jgi:hypothetical protein
MIRLTLAFFRAARRLEDRAEADRKTAREAMEQWQIEASRRLAAEVEVRRLTDLLRTMTLDFAVTQAYAEGLEREMADLLPGGES